MMDTPSRNTRSRSRLSQSSSVASKPSKASRKRTASTSRKRTPSRRKSSSKAKPARTPSRRTRSQRSSQASDSPAEKEQEQEEVKTPSSRRKRAKSSRSSAAMAAIPRTNTEIISDDTVEEEESIPLTSTPAKSGIKQRKSKDALRQTPTVKRVSRAPTRKTKQAASTVATAVADPLDVFTSVTDQTSDVYACLVSLVAMLVFSTNLGFVTKTNSDVKHVDALQWAIGLFFIHKAISLGYHVWKPTNSTLWAAGHIAGVNVAMLGLAHYMRATGKELHVWFLKEPPQGTYWFLLIGLVLVVTVFTFAMHVSHAASVGATCFFSVLVGVLPVVLIFAQHFRASCRGQTALACMALIAVLDVAKLPERVVGGEVSKWLHSSTLVNLLFTVALYSAFTAIFLESNPDVKLWDQAVLTTA